MKKITLVSAAILFSVAGFAQSDSTHKMMNGGKMSHDMNHQSMNKSHGDGVMMMNGKMMMEHNGKMTMMERDTMMANGTRIMTDGRCIKKDGSKMMMKEGQHMDMSGKMMPMKNAPMTK